MQKAWYGVQSRAQFPFYRWVESVCRDTILRININKCLGFEKWVDSTSKFGRHVCHKVGRVRAKTRTGAGHVG